MDVAILGLLQNNARLSVKEIAAEVALAPSSTHERIKRMRGNPDAVSVVDGYVTIEVLPLGQAALMEVQSVGLLPDGVQIPDLTRK